MTPFRSIVVPKNSTTVDSPRRWIGAALGRSWRSLSGRLGVLRTRATENRDPGRPKISALDLPVNNIVVRGKEPIASPACAAFRPFAKMDSSMPTRDVTNIRLERIDSPEPEERNTVFTTIAGIFVIAMVITYAGYCFYTTAEKINKSADKFEIDRPRGLPPKTDAATAAPSK
jgi:hypothetical protein